MQAKTKDIDPSDQLWDDILRQSLEDENGPQIGPAAQKHLDQGHPIYYAKAAYPGEIIKQYPDGHREIVDYDNEYKEVFVRSIP